MKSRRGCPLTLEAGLSYPFLSFTSGASVCIGTPCSPGSYASAGMVKQHTYI